MPKFLHSKTGDTVTGDAVVAADGSRLVVTTQVTAVGELHIRVYKVDSTWPDDDGNILLAAVDILAQTPLTAESKHV